MSLPMHTFNPWKRNLIKEVKSKLHYCKQYKYNNVLSKPAVVNELSKLHSDFALVPVDKAASNIAIICKKYYVEVMSEEIEESTTFGLVDVNKDQLLSDLITLYPNAKIVKKFPFLYATAKMHKVPKSFRFITSGKNALFSELSAGISKCLKLLVKTARTSYGYRIKEIDNSIFIIDNRDKVVKLLDDANFVKYKNKCISSWDFSTLYTTIPHNKLKDKLTVFINNVFAEVAKSKKGYKFICCSSGSYSAYFSKNESRSKNVFCCSMDNLIQCINIIIDNSYVSFHDKLYRQIVGVPMGTSCAPYLANLFLHVYEYDYLKCLISNGDVDTARKLSKTFRYQDDCISINDDEAFKEHFLLMYPSEMHLKNTNISKSVCTFLDLRISIFRGQFSYKSYDKRDDFNFDICNYPNLHGNVPWKSSYGVYVSQLLRFCDINLNVKHFINDVKSMTAKFLQQGFIRHTLKYTFLKFCQKYYYRWAKFGVNLFGLVNNII